MFVRRNIPFDHLRLEILRALHARERTLFFLILQWLCVCVVCVEDLRKSPRGIFLRTNISLDLRPFTQKKNPRCSAPRPSKRLRTGYARAAALRRICGVVLILSKCAFSDKKSFVLNALTCLYMRRLICAYVFFLNPIFFMLGLKENTPLLIYTISVLPWASNFLVAHVGDHIE